jgi:IclR family acetate operon transcriptional repressor
VLPADTLVRRTPKTLTALSKIKHRYRAHPAPRGYSLDDEEYHPGVRCLATPVFGSDGTVVAAVGITASVVRFIRPSASPNGREGEGRRRRALGSPRLHGDSAPKV